MVLSITAVLLLSLLFFLLLSLLHYRTKLASNSKIFPGPRPLPIIGNLHQVGRIVHRSLFNLSKLHGPIFQLNLGLVPALVISSPSLAEQVLKTHVHAFCSRPPIIAFEEYSYKGCDVAAAPYGDSWRNLRKIFILELLCPKKLSSYRSVREEETDRMIDSIKTRCDANPAINITELMVRLANNIISRVAFGYREEGEYGEKSRFQTLLEVANANVASFYAGDCFPGFRWIDEITGQLRKLRRNAKEIDEFYQEVIDQHLKGERKEGFQEDIVDVLLGLWKEKQLSMDHIKGALMNIFVAGTDSTSATVTWAMAELARNPNAMKKAQDEVRRVIGKKGKVEESDLPRLQYLKFVANETLRMHPPVPLLIPRETVQHCTINGYSISPKTRVIVNAWAIGRDEAAWEEPEEFNPDRFIDSKIDYRGQDFQFLPFGAGRRVCPGIQFGISNVELALANLLYAFNWELPAGMRREGIDMHEAPGLITQKRIALSLVARVYQDKN